MFCRKCGKEIDGSSKFCEFCGEAALEPAGNPNVEIKTEIETQNSIVRNPSDKSGNKVLKIIEIFLWLGAGIILLNLLNDYIDWWQIISAETILLSGLGYIKGWHKNFEIPLVLMILGLISNLSIAAWLDITLYAAGVYGVILKKKSID